MRLWIRRSIELAAAAVVVAPLVSGHGGTSRGRLAAQESVEIEEWDVPWEGSRPRDPYVAPDGMVWFVGQTADYAARLDPADGSFERFDLPSGCGPHNLIVDRKGIVWYAGNRAAHIGRLDPATGEIAQYPMPDSRASDPHTLVFDSQGQIWFTVQHGTMIGRFDPASGAVDLVEVPTADSRPYGIVVDADDRPWVVEFAGGKVATVDPVSLELREYDLRRPETRPRRLVVTSDGGVWYVDYAGGLLGRLDRQTGAVTEIPLPGGASSRPYGMAVDEADRIWLVETGIKPNRLVGFDTHTSEFVGQADIPSGAGSVRHMYYDAERREVWFGTDANTVGRAKLP
jgi:virginiamycin B lyase